MLLSNIDDDCHIVFRLRSGVCAAADTRSHRFTLNPLHTYQFGIEISVSSGIRLNMKVNIVFWSLASNHRYHLLYM